MAISKEDRILLVKKAREAKAMKRINSLKEKENNYVMNIMKVSDGIITYNETQKTLNFTLKDVDTSSTSSNNSNTSKTSKTSNTSNEEPKKRTKYLGCIKKFYLDISYHVKDYFKNNYDIHYDKTNELWFWEGKKSDMPSALKKRVIT